jgi:hypothetical protein
MHEPRGRYTDDEDYESDESEHIDEEDQHIDDRLSLIELSPAGSRLPHEHHEESMSVRSRERICCTGRRKALALATFLLILYLAMKYDIDEAKWVVTEIESDLLGSRCINATFIQSEPNTEPFVSKPVPLDYNFSSFVPLGGGRFTEYKDGDSPFVITEAMKSQSDQVSLSRRVHVLNAMKHVWKNYKDQAFGKDELLPISGKGIDNWGGMGTT